MRNRGLAFKLILFIVTGAAGVLLIAFTYYYLASKESALKYVQENTKNLAHATVNRIEAVLQGVEKIPLNFSSLLLMGRYETQDIPELVYRMVASNPEVFGAAIAYEPFGVNPDTYFYSPYCYRGENGQVVRSFLGSESYQYFTMDWYQIPKELARSGWTEPYYDEGGGNILMATFSVPFYKKANGVDQFQGVVTVDIALSWLQEVISAIRLYQSGYAFLISQNGVFVTHPESSLIMRHSIFSIAEEKQSQFLREIGKDMIRGGERLVSLESNLLSDHKSWLYYAPLSSIGWSLGIVVPESELFTDVHRLGRQVVLIGLAGLVLIVLIVMLISHRITLPLKYLVTATRQIARGNLDGELPAVRSEDEIGALTASFDAMRVALKAYVKNLTETTATKERIESELKIARSIQMSFLPKTFPPFPGMETFEISARLEPAREIGGDLYDFFPLDDDHLFFTVGDVSGKGIPAALFMAVTKTLLKGTAEINLQPSEIMSKTNVELCCDNDSMMFVTLFCGILNLRTGLLRYSNAGHEPPILLRRGKAPEWLTLPVGFVLGTVEDASYHTREIQLEPGDTIVVYTDGVTEAVNANGEMYTDGRLLNIVRQVSEISAQGITDVIMQSVQAFSDGLLQADDITLLVLTFGTPGNGKPG